MNCRKVSHLLSAYMDGELPGVEHRQIHEHLAQCGECTQEYRGLLQTKRLLAGMKMREPQSELAASILSEVSTRHADPRKIAAMPVRSAWWERLAQWTHASGPRPQYLAVASGLAIVGIVVSSYTIDHNEQIVFHPETPASIAALQPAPAQDTALPASANIPVYYSNVGNDNPRWLQPDSSFGRENRASNMAPSAPPIWPIPIMTSSR